MEDFISDEIDFVLEGLNDGFGDDRSESIELTEKQRKEIIESIINGYDYIWEELNNAIEEEINKVLED